MHPHMCTIPDLQCDPHEALDVFHLHLFAAEPLAAVIGAGCSEASEAVAEVAQYYNLSTVLILVIKFDNKL